MAKSYRRVDRDQQFLLPPDMADWLAQDHLAWFVLDVVGQLDTSVFHRRHPMAGPGRQAYDPDMLLALLVYAYAVGQRSSRRIEALCATDVAFRVLCAQDAPDHSTIARFRSVHEDAFAGLFTQVLMLCARAGMGRVGTVAIDGTKIAANAARGANRGEQALRAHAERIMGEAAAADAAEDGQFGPGRGDELPASLADRCGRGERIRRALEDIDRQRAQADEQVAAEQGRAEEYLRALQEGQAPAGPTPKAVDPAAAALARLQRSQARHREASDRHQRNEAAKDIRRFQRAVDQAQAVAPQDDANGSTRRRRGAVDKVLRANTTDPDSRLMTTADGGSIQGYNAQIVVSDDHLVLAAELTQDANDLRAFEPMMHAAVGAVDHVLAARSGPEGEADDRPGGIGLVLADAGYLSNRNLATEGPDRLIALGKHRDMHRDAHQRPASGPPPPGATPIEQMRHRLRTAEGVQAYKRRAATVETVNAHLKDRIGLRRFSRRGLTAASSELHLATAALNLLKLHRQTPPATA